MEKPWKVIAAFVAVFMAGSVFGGFFALRMSRQGPDQNRARPAFANPQPFNPPPALQLLRRFAERLELTKEQRDKLRPAVNRAEEQLGRIRQTSLEQTEAILRRMQQEFRAELTPDQIRVLDRMQRTQNENFRRERQQRTQTQNFMPNQPQGTADRPGRQNRPFLPNGERNRPFPGPGGPDPQPPYGPRNGQFENRPPNPNPEFNRPRPPGEPGDAPVGLPPDEVR